MIGVMDCNNFFVSCERLFRPDLNGKPVAVLSSNDGVIVARSNELKAMGVPMGLPLFQAKQLIDMSEVTLFSSNFTLYRDVSSRVMQILAEEVGECEIYSIDEAFFRLSDTVTETELLDLRAKIIAKTGIPVSLGVGATKTLAKIAVEVEKKGSGVCVLNPESWKTLAAQLPCGDIWNIGGQTAKKLRALGIETAAAFMTLDSTVVDKNFGIAGRRVQDELLGIMVHTVGDTTEVLRQSLTSSRSFAKPLRTLGELESVVAYHIGELSAKLRQRQWLAGRLHLSLRASRQSDWTTHGIGTEVIFSEPLSGTHELTEAALKVLREEFNPDVPYKKAGVTLTNLFPEAYRQPSLFAGDAKETKYHTLDRVSDSLNERFGRGTLRLGVVQKSGAQTSALLRSPDYTTAWGDIPRVQAK